MRRDGQKNNDKIDVRDHIYDFKTSKTIKTTSVPAEKNLSVYEF